MRAIFGWFIYYFERVKKNFLNRYLQKRYIQRAKSVGVNVRFNGICKITGLENLEIGENVHIGDNALFRAEGGLKIGDNTHFARNVIIYTHSHNYVGQYLPYDDSFIYKEVEIGKNVWVGINTTILPGTIIGDGAIIGAGSTVVGKIPAGAIFGAAKASEIKRRDDQHYYDLESKSQYGGVNGKKYEK